MDSGNAAASIVDMPGALASRAGSATLTPSILLASTLDLSTALRTESTEIKRHLFDAVGRP